MVCILCDSLSFEIICKRCQQTFLKPNIKKRDNIISFYSYEEVESLIKYKYHPFGSRIFHILAKNSFLEFSKVYTDKCYSIPIDDKVTKGYSHTAILNRYLKSKYITPLYKVLLAQNNISYAGKSLEYRKNNKRDFLYKGLENIDAILVDDIVTTSTTINEAKEVLKKYNVNIKFSLVLVDKRW